MNTPRPLDITNRCANCGVAIWFYDDTLVTHIHTDGKAYRVCVPCKRTLDMPDSNIPEAGFSE